MGMWEENIRRYEARLETFAYLCVNFHAYMNVRPDGTPVAPIKAPMWGGIPVELREELPLVDLDTIRSAFEFLFTQATENGRHSIDLDDILEELNWCFNPNDIEGLKVVYMTPKDPTKQPKKKKKYQ